MKKILLLPICFLWIAGLEVTAAEPVRIVELFNFGWKFQAGETPQAQAVEYDDSAWRTLDLPHDFQFEQPWDQSAGGARGFKANGSGWYRKAFTADPAWKDKKVVLEFDGVMVWGEVWLNGQKIAGMDYGYLGCEADLSKHLDYEGKNVVAVYTSTEGNSRWYTGGGLFRDVYLVVREPISVARDGVFITTPVITAQAAQVSVQVEMEGITSNRQDIEIRADIYSPDGELVGRTSGLTPKNSKLKTTEIPLPEITVDNPRLWSCETPNLYTAEISVVLDGKVLDRVSETFGIRTIEYSKEFGFKLNGEKIFLKGIANHHDLGALGAAAYDQAIERLFIRLKEFGYNHVRTSHNPYSKSFMRLADKHGILVVDELCDKWGERDYWPGRLPFSQLWYKILPQWIKRDRNHPSVILWSLGNELQMREDLAGFPTGDWGVTTYRILDVLTKRYDPTRLTTVAMFPSRANSIRNKEDGFLTNFIPPELSLVTEIASYNYQYPAYPKYLEYAPDLIIYQSEATSNDLLRPFYGMDYDKMVGLAYWGAVEYWGESNGWPKKGWNFSFFNHALEPNPEAYLIKSAFSDEPLVHIAVVDSEGEELEWNDIIVGRQPTSSHWNREAGSTQKVFTYTNAEEVELLVNGKSVGIQKNETTAPERRNRIYWPHVPYRNGGNITAVARTGGREVARHRLETTGKATALKIEAGNPQWKADGMDLQYVKVYAVDNKGRVVPTFEGEVVFELSGAAGILAVDNGDHYTDELFYGNRKALHNGFAMAILRADREPGPVTLKARLEGIRPAQINMNTSGWNP